MNTKLLFLWTLQASVTRKIAKCLKKLRKNDFTKKWYILTPLQKLPRNVRDLGKLIAAKGFKKLPKVQKIDQSGHTMQLTKWDDKVSVPRFAKVFH